MANESITEFINVVNSKFKDLISKIQFLENQIEEEQLKRKNQKKKLLVALKNETMDNREFGYTTNLNYALREFCEEDE